MPNKIIKKTTVENWNNVVLPSEETLLRLPPEEAYREEIITPLITRYEEGIKTEITLYKKNKELRKLLEKRLVFIKTLIETKKELAIDTTDKNKVKNRITHITHLIEQLEAHKHYIETEYEMLEGSASESHFTPIILDLLAEAYDYLATLEWNFINPEPKKFFMTCLNVFTLYRKRVDCLLKENELLPKANKTLFRKGIFNTLDAMHETILELKKLIAKIQPQTVNHVKKLEAKFSEYHDCITNRLNTIEKLEASKSLQGVLKN
jgi:hypothetical protein